jgi:hypothetical protein
MTSATNHRTLLSLFLLAQHAGVGAKGLHLRSVSTSVMLSSSLAKRPNGMGGSSAGAGGGGTMFAPPRAGRRNSGSGSSALGMPSAASPSSGAAAGAAGAGVGATAGAAAGAAPKVGADGKRPAPKAVDRSTEDRVEAQRLEIRQMRDQVQNAKKELADQRVIADEVGFVARQLGDPVLTPCAVCAAVRISNMHRRS